MVFMEESRASAWLWPLRRSNSGGKRRDSPQASDDDGEGGSGGRGRAFDIADDMEKGLARELVADFMEPPPAGAGHLRKLRVERSEDRLQYRLFSQEDGKFLMFAEAAPGARRVDLYLYDPTESSLFDSDRPAFVLTANSARTEWRMAQERCDQCHYTPKRSPCRCRGSRDLVVAKHWSQDVGEGVSHCMDVQLPAASPASGDRSPGRGEERRLVSRLPTWNEKVDSLVLDFKGRRVQPSAKNFQLAVEGKTERAVCQYGKMSPNSFGLDYKHPLTVAQAFGLALTTLFWA